MSDAQDILVPDIGDFDNVDVIEVLVAPGDKVEVESPLITLESDKATMDVPSPVAGTVTEVRIAVGDQVSQGSLVAKVEAATPASEATAPIEEAPKSTADSAPRPEPSVPEKPDPAPLVAPSPPPSLPPAIESDGEPLPHASPAVRRFARELGADLSKISGTGTHGRIL